MPLVCPKRKGSPGTTASAMVAAPITRAKKNAYL
jgi:hypothetical protein